VKPTEPDEPRPLTEDALQLLANIAAIEVAAQVSFKSALRAIFETARNSHPFDLWEPRRRDIAMQLAKVKKAAAPLISQLDKLDDGARRALGLSVLRYLEFGPAQNWDEHVLQVCDLIEVANGRARAQHAFKGSRDAIEVISIAASSYEFRASSKGGAPSKSPALAGNPRVSTEDLFVLEICGCVDRHDGQLTLDKNRKTGTLIEFLKVAAHHLPRGLIRECPSSSRLQRLKTEATGQKPKR